MRFPSARFARRFRNSPRDARRTPRQSHRGIAAIRKTHLLRLRGDSGTDVGSVTWDESKRGVPIRIRHIK